MTLHDLKRLRKGLNKLSEWVWFTRFGDLQISLLNIRAWIDREIIDQTKSDQQEKENESSIIAVPSREAEKKE